MPLSSCISHLLPQFNKQHLKHSDIAPVIKALEAQPSVNVQIVGNSFEQRPIHLLSLGHGPIVVFAWTQMHGDEATATASVFDLLDTIISQPEEALRLFKDVFTLHILPLLNPDGAQRCIRQNAQSIDINRDARDLQTPEGKLLMSLVAQLKPNIGFNLHDQSPYYKCGATNNPATIAFLAPAFDVAKTIDSAREKAMLLIAHMNKGLQEHIPGCVARYDDTYSSRSFGDTIAGKNVSTILIESGAAKNDDNRQIARAMNVVAMSAALDYLMAEQGNPNSMLGTASVADYFAIPENVPETLSSLIIRNISFMGAYPYQIGLSIKQTARYSNEFLVDFTGDLHEQAGLREFDATGLLYKRGEVYVPKAPMTISNESYKALLRKGYLYIHDPEGMIENNSDYDMCYSQQAMHDEHAFVLQMPAYCLFVDKQQPQNVTHAVLNGSVFMLTNSA